MSEDKRIIGSSEVTKDQDTNTYSIEFYLQESELADYEPNYHDIATWAPMPARVVRVQKKELTKGYYILTIEAEPDETATGSFYSSSKTDITDRYEWKYEDRQLYYHPKMWGVRRADKDDVAKKAKNIYEKTAAVKDFIFKNYATDAALLGSADYSESPFNKNHHPAISMLGHKRAVPHFIVVYYSKRKPRTLRRFAGLNGRFPAKFDVHNGGIPGKWRLLKQDLESYLNEGRQYVKVTRIFTYAWGGRFDPDKCIGYWKSWEHGGIQEK